jgi:hypothetical protein
LFNRYSLAMELFTSVILGLVAIALGVALVVYAFKGRQSQARRITRLEATSLMVFTIPEGLHPELNPLAWIVGTWRGKGRGEYPGVEPFEYAQEVVFQPRRS